MPALICALKEGRVDGSYLAQRIAKIRTDLRKREQTKTAFKAEAKKKVLVIIPRKEVAK